MRAEAPSLREASVFPRSFPLALGDALVSGHEPFRREGLTRRLAPFAAATAFAFATVPLPPARDAHWPELAGAAALSVLIAAAIYLVPWRRLPASSQTLPVLAYLGVVALLGQAEGGASSGFSPLAVLVPVVWLALYGSVRELAVATASIAATLAIPILTVGRPEYPPSEWRSVLVSTAVAGFVGFTVRRLVRVATRVAREADARTEELARSELRFRRTFEESPSGTALMSLAGAFQQVNAALCKLTGYPTEQLEGMTVGDITHPDDLPVYLDAVRPLIAGVVSRCEIEQRCVHAAGHAVWVRIGATITHGPEGEPVQLLAQFQDDSERRDYEDRLEHMADHDPLTGLFNRRRFERELERHVAHVARYGEGGAAMVLDIDHFKYVNDTHGHSAGDRLLVSVAGVLRERLRETDVVARIGGDEFALLLPRADAAGARVIAESVRRAVREEVSVPKADRPWRVTTSVGIAMFEPGARLTGEDIVVNADLAMYAAKAAGRDRFAFYAPEERRRSSERARMGWIDRVRRALDEDGFVLYAQPILDLRNAEVDRYELLLRMVGDDGELILPGAFLHVAERFDLVQAIDCWVAKQAIALLVECERAGRATRLEVNVSGKSIGDRALLAEISEGLAASTVDPTRLIFELTETAAVANFPAAKRFAGQLSELGCQLALDDFGAGFGSFYYLKHLPCDYLKIDGEFVRNCVADETDQIVIDAVVGIARGLGKETIAEFVADEYAMIQLRRHGVDFAQGFHVGRPQPVGDARTWAASALAAP